MPPMTAAAGRLLTETSGDGTAEQIDLPFPAVIVIVVLLLCVIISGCVCFIKRCFAPNGQKGPLECADPTSDVLYRDGDGLLHPAKADVRSGNRGPSLHNQAQFPVSMANSVK